MPRILISLGIIGGANERAYSILVLFAMDHCDGDLEIWNDSAEFCHANTFKHSALWTSHLLAPSIIEMKRHTEEEKESVAVPEIGWADAKCLFAMSNRTNQCEILGFANRARSRPRGLEHFRARLAITNRQVSCALFSLPSGGVRNNPHTRSIATGRPNPPPV
jgi:hypothetical protein